MTSFRLRGKAHLFTWAQVPATTTHHDVVELLGDAVAKYVIAKENHEDGGIHYHAYIEWKKAQDRNLSERFYLHGQRPNVKPKRTKTEKRAARQYCRKDGCYIESGFDDVDGDCSEEEKPSDKLQACLETAEGDVGQFIKNVLDAGISHPMLRDFWNAANATWRKSTIYDAEHVREWTISSFTLQVLRFDPLERRSYIIRGSSGIGKTTWAFRNIPVPCLWVRHADDLRLFREEVHKAILLDDVCFTHTPRQNQLNMVDKFNQVSIHVRYGVARIPADIPRIFTCNPGFEPVDLNDEAIARRCYVVDC